MTVLANNEQLPQTACIVVGGTITLRTEYAGDVAKLVPLVPLDQEKQFTARWEGGCLVLELMNIPKAAPAAIVETAPTPVSDDKISELMQKSDADLQTLAAERSVRWDKKASRETMVERIVRAA